MTRRMKRTADYEIAVTIKNDAFIRPPRETQRNWLLNGALRELADRLDALDDLARRFVPGITGGPVEDRTQAVLRDEEIMEDWQIPLMRAMADVVTEDHGDVLEIGFGRGVSATFIQERGARSHTVIECNDDVVRRFETWREGYPDADISMQHGLWQDVLDGLGTFDGVFFHTYPLTEADFVAQIGESSTFAEHFFPHAAAHLSRGGVFTYLSNEMDSLSRTHQRRLLAHFSEVSVKVVDSLPIQPDVADAWWSDSMVVVKATK